MNDIFEMWRKKIGEDHKYQVTTPTAQMRNTVAQSMCDHIIDLMQQGEYDIRIMSGRDTALIRFMVTNYPAIRSTMVQELIAYKINSQFPYLEVVKMFYTKSSDVFHIHICPRLSLWETDENVRT